MDSRATAGLSRRRALGLLAVGALAGCVGGASDTGDSGGSNDDTETEAGGPGGDESDGEGSGTSLAGSCASAFGDTDQPYDVGGSRWVATFDYPMGGEVFYEDDTSRGSVASFGYVETDLEGNYEHQVLVSQRGPSEDTDPDIGGTLIAEDDSYEDGGTVTFGGEERRVAVLRTDGVSIIWTMGVLGPDDQTYRLEVQASVASGDPCPETYEAVCERVMTSFERR